MAQDDSDSDNVGDVCDNCPDDYNPTQTDTDENRYGDICDVIGGTDKDMYVVWQLCNQCHRFLFNGSVSRIGSKLAGTTMCKTSLV